MISIALFPCRYTDAARITGELSYTLCQPVYTDSMLLEEVSKKEGVPVKTLQEKLFSDDQQKHRRSMEKEILIDLLRQRCTGLLADSTNYIYYGFFSSLLESNDHLIQKILILSDEKSRIQRATRQEKITEEIARKLIKEHDQKAACWAQFLFNKPPYSPDLYDTVIRYEGQDLLDVIAYIFMLQEEQVQHEKSGSAPFFT